MWCRPDQKSARINRIALLWPLIKGTWPATHLTLRSIAPTNSTGRRTVFV
jgi:hypothetical protein